MKKLIRITLLIFTSLCFAVVSGQKLDKTQADREAQQILNQYQAELGLAVEQAMKFHHKVSEYLIKRSEIETKSLAPQTRKSELTRLSNEETTEMSSILNNPQLKIYKKLKPKIQPIR